MKQEIRHQWTGEVIFGCDVPDSSDGMDVLRALEKAVLTGADLTGADLTGAVLIDVDLRDVELRGAVLTGADLRDAFLRGADLTCADLTGADLTGAVLIDADLRDAFLTGADLTGADLTGADLTGAVLIDVNLRGTVLTGVDLTGADLRGANGEQLPRATPEQAVKNLDKVRAIILAKRSRLQMGHWHQNSDWKEKTCEEETLCETTHCLAGWLQVCTTEPALKTIDAQLAGILAAPVAAKMFFRKGNEVLAWLATREYAKA